MELSLTSRWLAGGEKHAAFERWVAAFTFVWPFAYLSPYLVAVPGLGRQSGNDFDIIYYRHKTYLLDVLASQGWFPMWSPSEAAGSPFFTSPFTASAYPLNIPLAGIYRVLEGYSHYDHQIYSILAVAIFSLGLYRWLRATKLPVLPALMAALALGVSMKITELMRMTNALHAAAWMPWILLGMTRIAERKTLLRGAAIVTAATVMLLTASYPYYVYYFQFLAGPYLLVLLFEPSRRALFAAQVSGFPGAARFLLGLAASFGLALAICSPYLFRVVELVGQAHARGGTDFDFATTAVWDLPSTLGALVYPPAASAEGWYYFGLIHLFVILLFVAGATRRQTETRLDRRLVILVLAFTGTISWISLGRESHLFWLLWKIWPGFSTLRHWPRINIILLPGLALLLGRAYFGLFLQLRAEPRGSGLGQLLRPLSWSFGIVLLIQLIFLSTGYVSYQWPLYFQRYFDHLPWIDKPWYLAMGTLSWLALYAVFVWARRMPQQFARRGLVVALSIVAIGALDVAPLGILQWSEPRKLQDMIRRRPYVVERMKLALERPRTAIYTTVPLTPDFNLSGIEDWYYERYIGFLESQGLDKAALKQPARWRENAAFAQFMGLVDGNRFYFTSSLAHPSIASFLTDSESTEMNSRATLRVEHYNGDELELQVETDRAVYLSFIDNWDPNWTATVNGDRVPIEKLFGTFKAIQLKPGSSRVEFRYAPF